jgi:protein-L-isoaspartate(D-aspartate) O-methyltransferase
MRKEDGDLLEEGVVELLVRDGWKGYPEGAPYNAIHVGAAAETFPRELMSQMAVGGVM